MNKHTIGLGIAGLLAGMISWKLLPGTDIFFLGLALGLYTWFSKLIHGPGTFSKLLIFFIGAFAAHIITAVITQSSTILLGLVGYPISTAGQEFILRATFLYLFVGVFIAILFLLLAFRIIKPIRTGHVLLTALIGGILGTIGIDNDATRHITNIYVPLILPVVTGLLVGLALDKQNKKKLA